MTLVPVKIPEKFRGKNVILKPNDYLKALELFSEH